MINKYSNSDKQPGLYLGELILGGGGVKFGGLRYIYIYIYLERELEFKK